MKQLPKAVLPLAFKASGLHCGIKKSQKPDLALFFSFLPAKAACLFTSNKIKAAPIRVCQEYLASNRAFHAIIANSGNANCFTGASGFADAQKMSRFAAEALGVDKKAVLVASTGIIGKRMDVGKIAKAMPRLVPGLSSVGIHIAKKAIMTTDTFPKEFTVGLSLGREKVTITGVAKGAGMIAPDMATMLVFIFTDAVISQPALEKALRMAVDSSFNCITVDGCMSTNDSVFVMANGAAANREITENVHFPAFAKGLSTVCLELAKMMVRDGEGASKFIQINVSGAKDSRQARRAALFIANSNLFKTAVYGENPNFGRVIAAVGASGIDVDEGSIKVRLGPLTGKNVNVDVRLNKGKGAATIYTSDLTPEYIKINAEYS